MSWGRDRRSEHTGYHMRVGLECCCVAKVFRTGPCTPSLIFAMSLHPTQKPASLAFIENLSWRNGGVVLLSNEIFSARMDAHR